MDQALDPAAYIHEGFWINWTKGSTRGLTLTLSSSNANLLVAMLALFVTMSGGQLWTIIRFGLHQSRAYLRSQSLNTLHNQQQLILRNITTDFASARLLTSLAWNWRSNGKNAFSSSIVLVLLAVTHAVFFMIAGTFSSNVASADPAVLSRSPDCGLFNATYLEMSGYGNINAATDETFRLSLEFFAKNEQEVQLSLDYARQCYMSTDTNYLASSCNSFQQSRLYWKTLHNGTCPFDLEVCSENSTTIVLDTGPIDSHDTLGINAKFDDRLVYRRITNCTVLNDAAYVTGWVNQTDSTNVQSSLETAFAYYGKSLTYSTNWTYAKSNFAEFQTNFSGLTTIPYQIQSQTAYGESQNPSASTFAPLPELKQAHADLTLLFLSYNGRYIAPTDDLWFSAHQLYRANSHAGIAKTTYIRDRPISTLACTEQHQICTSGGVCTAALGFDQVQDAIAAEFTHLTANQNATLDRILKAATASSIGTVVNVLAKSTSPLLAINSAATESTTLSLGLPRNQWQAEAGFFHSVAMAHFQRTFVQYGTGQIAAQTKYLVAPTTPSGKWICENLMIRGTTFQSFSVLALALMLGFGTLIIVISLTIESLASYIQTKYTGGVGRKKIWDDHDMFGLQIWKKSSQQLLPSRNGSFLSFLSTRDHKSGHIECKVEEVDQMPTTRKDDEHINHCVICGVTETSTWHIGEPGQGWSCDSCLQWYQRHMKGFMPESKDGRI